MLSRIVEIAESDRYLSLHRGFLIVSQKHAELARIPLDDIGALIGNANGLTYSNNVMVALAERGVPSLLCASNHRPAAVIWPLDQHHLQAERIHAQATARRPLKKSLWQSIVRRKLLEQARVLEAHERPHKVLLRLERRVRSGDPSNIEAQAARFYWRALFGKDFKRDPDLRGTNALLNYGYAVVRAATARAVVAAGLHPSLGIFHRSGANSFQLVDDLMEPCRPMVDAAVLGLQRRGVTEVNRDAKLELARIPYFDRSMPQGRAPVVRCLDELATSVAQAFAKRDASLNFPELLTVDDVRALTDGGSDEDEGTLGVSDLVAHSDV
jgi:CRISPR-associated protein Cas1